VTGSRLGAGAGRRFTSLSRRPCRVGGRRGRGSPTAGAAGAAGRRRLRGARAADPGTIASYAARPSTVRGRRPASRG